MRAVPAFADDETVQSFNGMIGASDAMAAVFRRISIFANTNIPILIEGETGVGKEMVVQAIRALSGNGARYVALNCAAIPKDLVESELFGHERGAFTGAFRRHAGIIPQANEGTLFLDEISGLPLQAQAKLLRALESGEFRPVGGERVQRSSFRLIAAANESLPDAVSQGRFRLDLLHRLGAARIFVPPLRSRRDDIPLLVEAFLSRFRAAHRFTGPSAVSAGALRRLQHADWPGNVRELRHVVEAAAALSRGRVVTEHDIEEVMDAAPSDQSFKPEGWVTLAEAVRTAEAKAIKDALNRTRGNRDQAAEMLGVSVATLYRRLACDSRENS